MIREDRSYRDPQFSAVRRAIELMVPGFRNLRVRRAPHLGSEPDLSYRREPTLLIDKGEQTLALDQLSHGEQGLISLVGDIARRLVLTHPTLEDPLQGDGLILIDEVDLHLHPKWQRMVVPALERTFPNCQFVITTHSPQVLAHVDRENVRILESGHIVEATPHTYGRDTNSILLELMGLPIHPELTAPKLREISDLIEQEDFGRAREELNLLARQMGEQDVEIVRRRALIDFLST